MKKLKFLFSMLLMAVMTVSFNACSDDDPTPNNPDEPAPGETTNYHFDIWIALDRHGGMGRDVQTLVRSVESLEAGQPAIDFVGEGTEVNYKLTLEAIVKGAYYYQVPVEGGKFGKYTLSNNTINTIQEQKFVTNVYSPRKYAHAWLDENTLLIMAADGDTKNIIWTKLNAGDLSIISEGTLNLPLPTGAEGEYFTTSGILAYRETDNKLFYFYYGKLGSGMKAYNTSPFWVASIDAETMEVETCAQNSLNVGEMVGSAYGELLQKCTFTDENGYVYLASFTEDENDNEVSSLIRIKPGESNFEAGYNAFQDPGKLLSVEYLGNGKLLAYARNNEYGTGIDSYSHYYTIIDLNSCTHKPLECDGQPLPYSGGRFSQRTTIAGGKAYIGVNPENSNPCIYIYDIATGTTSKGVDLAEGYYFEQIRAIEND